MKYIQTIYVSNSSIDLFRKITLSNFLLPGMLVTGTRRIRRRPYKGINRSYLEYMVVCTAEDKEQQIEHNKFIVTELSTAIEEMRGTYIISTVEKTGKKIIVKELPF